MNGLIISVLILVYVFCGTMAVALLCDDLVESPCPKLKKFLVFLLWPLLALCVFIYLFVIFLCVTMNYIERKIVAIKKTKHDKKF